MKKLLLGAMMSALFVMNANAGMWSSIRNKTIQFQHKMKKDRTMDEKDIQIFKEYLGKILTTAKAFYKILDNVLDKEHFQPCIDNLDKLVMFSRTSYKKGAIYDDGKRKEVQGYIDKITNNSVQKVLDEYKYTAECVNFIDAVKGAFVYAQNLQQKYPTNEVLKGVVMAFTQINDFVTTGKTATRQAEPKVTTDYDIIDNNAEPFSSSRNSSTDYDIMDNNAEPFSSSRSSSASEFDQVNNNDVEFFNSHEFDQVNDGQNSSHQPILVRNNSSRRSSRGRL